MLGAQLKKDLRRAKSITVASAVVTKGAIRWLDYYLPSSCENKTMIFGMFNRSTDDNSDNPEYATGHGGWKVLINDNLHAKLISIRTKSHHITYLGSSNLSMPSLDREEMNIRYESKNLPRQISILLKRQNKITEFENNIKEAINDTDNSPFVSDS